jgi:hypothetical protein
MKSVICSLLVLCAFAFSINAQTKTRLVEWLPNSTSNFLGGENGRMIPTDLKALELLEISVDSNPIAIGEKFNADSDWLRGFAAKVRNVSDKAISSIRISFILPEAEYKSGTRGFSLEYGKELSTGIDYGSQRAIGPGEEVKLIRNERHYERDRTGLIETNGAIDITKVVIVNSVVKFVDGSSWFGPPKK